MVQILLMLCEDDREQEVKGNLRRCLQKPSLANCLERLCSLNADNRIVFYTTMLKEVQIIFEACNAVRATFKSFGVLICKRDVSMDSGFREELGALLEGKKTEQMVPPRVFMKGFYIDGAEVMFKVMEKGLLDQLLEGLLRKKRRGVCRGCGSFTLVVSATVHLLRGLSVGLGIKYSCAEQWKPNTDEALSKAGRINRWHYKDVYTCEEIK
ncbi:hypothetical protein RJT34_02941 [Clitoria ternatea]|uniref:Glutaredoxin domain-containing protein n=1 Tax=Clitoria ternatea TaxID=43366 RepID=A0AAN9Q1A3_CLITE